MFDRLPIVEEQQAQGHVREIYRDIKRTMAVPYVDDVFRSIAAYPPLLHAAWREIKPVIGTIAFEALADRIRAHADACARHRMYVPDHAKALEERGVDPAVIDRIREAVEVFHCGEPRCLVIAAAVKESLRRGALVTSGPAHTSPGPPQPLNLLAPFNPAQPARVSPDAQEALDDARLTLGIPFDPVGFASLARWPMYLPIAWQDVKGQVRTAEFRRHRDELSGIALGGLRELPRSMHVDASAIRDAGVDEAQMGQIYAAVDLLYTHKPTLVGATALLRLGLNSLLELEAGA